MLSVFLALGLLAGTEARADDAKVLRIITWADYVPAEVIAQFRKETGIQVQVTLSNNEEMISKLRATGGAGFDTVNVKDCTDAGVLVDLSDGKQLLRGNTMFGPKGVDRIQLEVWQDSGTSVGVETASLEIRPLPNPPD